MGVATTIRLPKVLGLFLTKSPIFLQKNPILPQKSPGRGHTGSAIPLALHPSPYVVGGGGGGGGATTSRLPKVLGLFLTKRPIF